MKVRVCVRRKESESESMCETERKKVRVCVREKEGESESMCETERK